MQNTLVPAPPQRAARILALTAAGDPVPRQFARLVGALRDAGAEVVPLPVPSEAPPSARESLPSVTDLKRMARDLVSSLRGAPERAVEPWIASQLRELQGHFDAAITTDPRVAFVVFPHVTSVWPEALRIAVDGDYDVDAEWRSVPFDDLVVPHPGAARGVAQITEGRARLRSGGPLAATDVPAKRVAEDRPQLVVSFARLDPGDVDPLLFQLSLAHPERFDLLFLPSGRTGVDELVRTRAGGYGLQGKRTKPGADGEPWIRGAAALVGHPHPEESAVAVAAGVPQLLFAPDGRLSPGDAFLVERGAALRSDLPITIAVSVEALLPGGADRERVLRALAELEPSGPRGAAEAVLEAIAEGRPAEPAGAAVSASSGPHGDELEDIGGAPPATAAMGPGSPMPVRLRRAYLREIIVQQGQVQRQLTKAQAGLATWQRRVQLARNAGDHTLAGRAMPRVEGLFRLVERLAQSERELAKLRERFASNQPLSEADRAAASRFMNPETAVQLDRGDAPDSAFTQLEIEDQLAALKRKATPTL